jgi:excisionase family DNA binding protein
MARPRKHPIVVPALPRELILLSVAQTATTCGVDRDTVHDWLNSGKLTCLRMGKKMIKIRQSELERFLQSFEQEVAAS